MQINSNGNYGFQDFGAMKKSQFKGLDLLCVNTFKAPIEKYNSNSDLQNWASKKLVTDVFSKDLEGRTPRVTIERKSVMENWKDFLSNAKTISAAAGLVIMSSIFGKLSPKNDDVPPPLNEEALNKTLQQVSENPNANFQKSYLKTLKNEIIGFDIDNYTGWIKIPSKDNDEANYEKNLEKLKLLSSSSWCTKASGADTHLMRGNFHIYYDKGQPKLGVQMSYPDEIDEIQGVENDFSVPANYYDVMNNFIKENHLSLSDKADDTMYRTKQHIRDLKLAQESLKEDINNKNYTNILKYFNIERTENPDGTAVLSAYHDYIDYKTLGIDVQDMLKDVVEIKGDCDLRKAKVTDLSNLKTIGGFADFTDSQISNLSNLKSIGRGAIFKNSNVKELNSLESCPNLNVSYSEIKELPNFKDGKVTSDKDVKLPLLK